MYIPLNNLLQVGSVQRFRVKNDSFIFIIICDKWTIHPENDILSISADCRYIPVNMNICPQVSL
jgi:hypothetical protein